MRFPGTIIFLLLLALLLVAHAPSWGFAKPKAPKITQGTWQRFLSLADSILRINETIQVLPEPHYISLKLESIHPVNLQKCRHWVASNPNCPAKGSIHFECAFTSRMFDAQLLQHRPLEWGNFRVSLENKEMIRYRQLQGSLKGAMVECCESTWRKEPIVFPYLFKVHIERVARCSMTQRSELQMPETKNAEEVRDLLRGFLNSYFRIYLSEYFYAPPC
uniref:TonB box n=1 Tax=Echinococcus granulosus TaxID=6210 RepID=A0A068WRK4_ECHGR|nr:TonB box [Echinococcus granulosus]